jgi:hypothetical protein
MEDGGRCPKCHYHGNYPEELYYFDKDTKYKTLSERLIFVGYHDIEKQKELELKGIKIYPVYKDYTFSFYASYEFGVNGHDWNELHFCPYCEEEYSFTNSDY